MAENKALKQDLSKVYLYKILSSLFLKVPCVLEHIHNIPSTPIYSPIFLLIYGKIYFALKAMKEGKIEMLTDGKETRQFLHAEDCSKALYMIAKNPTVFASRSYDITSFQWTTIEEIANVVSSICGNVPVTPGTKEDTVQKLVDIPPNEEILLYWEPKLTLEEGIRNVIASIEEIHGKVL